MRYISTRGKVDSMSFKDAVLMGLANDGGLLLPEHYPVFSLSEIKALSKLSYSELAFEIMSLYSEGLPKQQLKDIIDRSYRTFSHPEITPVVKKGGIYILELFHGPTLAFKDLALQFLGNLFEDLVNERKGKMNILGATSGDTGSAAIYGLKNKTGINIFILHPKREGLAHSKTPDDHGDRPECFQSGHTGDLRRRPEYRQADFQRLGVQGPTFTGIYKLHQLGTPFSPNRLLLLRLG